MDLIVTPADPGLGVKVTITRSFLPHPTIRFMTANEWAHYEGWGAFYYSVANELVLTPNTDEENVIGTLIHELTHWAEYMALTKEEREWEEQIYARLERDHNETWMANRHICENLAYWMEMDL